jgi:hypothetical protein
MVQAANAQGKEKNHKHELNTCDELLWVLRLCMAKGTTELGE